MSFKEKLKAFLTKVREIWKKIKEGFIKFADKAEESIEAIGTKTFNFISKHPWLSLFSFYAFIIGLCVKLAKISPNIEYNDNDTDDMPVEYYFEKIVNKLNMSDEDHVFISGKGTGEIDCLSWDHYPEKEPEEA